MAMIRSKNASKCEPPVKKSVESIKDKPVERDDDSLISSSKQGLAHNAYCGWCSNGFGNDAIGEISKAKAKDDANDCNLGKPQQNC